jgi:hypothetical protein
MSTVRDLTGKILVPDVQKDWDDSEDEAKPSDTNKSDDSALSDRATQLANHWYAQYLGGRVTKFDSDEPREDDGRFGSASAAARPRSCPTCAGRGQIGTKECPTCKGSGQTTPTATTEPVAM